MRDVRKTAAKTSDTFLDTLEHTAPSGSAIRKKMRGQTLTRVELDSIVADIVEHRYSNVELAGFVVACANRGMCVSEVADLIRAIVNQGQWLRWNDVDRVFDKHCIGGVAGDRTTPIVVAICASFDLIMPRISSMAIALPSSTLDMMDVVTTVDLPLDRIRSAVSDTGACFALAGAVDLCPAVDVITRMEEALEVEANAQIVATALARKIAAGITDLVVEIPVGISCKIKDVRRGEELVQLFEDVAGELGIGVSCMLIDTEQPVGRGIGPLHEVIDVINVLRNTEDAWPELLDRAVMISAELLVMAGCFSTPQAVRAAYECVRSGKAWGKFLEICAAQGGIEALPSPRFEFAVTAVKSGIVRSMDNILLARLARLAGAPASPAAGLRLHCALGTRISEGMPLLTVYSAGKARLECALEFYRDNSAMITIAGSI